MITRREPFSTIWRRRLQMAVDHANLALRSGHRDAYLRNRAMALRAANALVRR